MTNDRSIDYNTHVDGIRWWEAPIPSIFHRCKTQTEGFLGGPLGDRVQRCACGAIRRNDGGWFERNQRRRERLVRAVRRAS